MSVSAEKRIPSEFAFCGHRLHQRQFLTQLPLSSVICSSLSKAERSKKGFNKSLHSDVWFDLFGNKQLSRQGTSKLARQIQIYLFPHFLRIFLNEKTFWLCSKKREVGLLTRDERKKNQKSLHQTFSPLWAGVNFFLEIITNCAFQFCHKLQKYVLKPRSQSFKIPCRQFGSISISYGKASIELFEMEIAIYTLF